MDFSAVFQTWLNAVTQPNEEFYDNERKSPNATLGTAIIWIVIAAIISAIVGVIGIFIGFGALSGSGIFDEILSDPEISSEVRVVMEAFLSGGGFAGLAGAGLVASIIFAPIGFLIGVGILHLIARLLGGQGDFGRYAYLNAAFQAPIQIVTSVLGLIPFLGGCVSFLLALYSLVLVYFATKTEHQLSQGRSIMVLLIPLIIGILLSACIVLAFISLAIPQFQ
ncbi:MAG: Yip1 family protein [Chloroflexota bacterium]